MELWLTLGALAAGTGVFAAAAIAERRPRRSLDVPLISPMPVMFAGLVIVILALVHLVNLAGVVTGR
jgi:hypothetical protein